jgi:hypothetical protein
MGIIFEDEIVENFKIEKVDDLANLIVEYLCGEKYWKKKLSKSEEELLKEVLNSLENQGLNYAQFNELLLLLEQDRVSQDFFNFFFIDKNNKNDLVKIDELKKGITKFRGYAMLCFGNFRFAYKKLITKNKEEIENLLKPYCIDTQELEEDFKARPPKVLDIKKIEKEKTYLCGYITQESYKNDMKYITKMITEKKAKTIQGENIIEIIEYYKNLQNDIKELKEKAYDNTIIYLSWDYMDVYVSTSMRYKWDYEEVFEFTEKLFDDPCLKELNIRYFDPTQSFSSNRIDKGLLECLMIKRVYCTVYMVQFEDTLGKDSELAVTLAQGKPVIAYIPEISDINSYIQKIKKYPLDYFQKRIFYLLGNDIFNEDDFKKELEKNGVSDIKEVEGIFREFTEKLQEVVLNLWPKAHEKFKTENEKIFNDICLIVSIIDKFVYDKRAQILKESHPLAIQVNLNTGVANGVLVVRKPEDCSKLIRNILTNSLSFKIKKDKGSTILEEKISGCLFRVVTDDEKLTNSFWNFYLI